jgi:hypothetical protein
LVSAATYVIDATERERVRGDFHRDHTRAGVAHLGEEAVQFQGKRRRVLERPRACAEHAAQRTDHTAR